MTEITKTLVQCDFDGTITEEDVSFMLLDTFAKGNWRQLLRQYEEGKISVGHFNGEAFAMVKADRESLLEVVRDKVKIRAGFLELVTCCRRRGFRLVIVSNGLDFYIDEILRSVGMENIEVFAAQTHFHPEGLKVQYVGPDGSHEEANFKGAYVNSFLNEGYRIIYAGNGTSDILAARRCHHVFAIGTLLTHYKQTNLDCIPFTDLNEVVRVLETL